MTGIVGWVDFDRGIEQCPDAGRAVAATMMAALVGATAEHDQVWAGPHAVIGLRPTPFTDNPRRGLATNCRGHPALVAALLGRCARRHAVAPVFRDDATPLLDGYPQWGDMLPKHLDGDYALVLWDAHRAELILTRDPLGSQPLYYRRLPDGVVFASRPDAVLAHPSRRARLSTDGIREMLAGIAVPGGTLYDDVHEVRAGHSIRFTRAGNHERRHWQLNATDHQDDTATTVRRTRELLEKAVRSRSAGGTVSSLLSGGLDSSTIAALLARRAEGPVRTFAVDYRGYEEGFQPHIARPSPDSPYVRDMVAHLGSAHIDVMLDTPDLTAPDLWRALVDVLDKPTILADVEPSMYLLYERVRQHADIVFGGEGADELFGGFPWFHHPQWALVSDFPWARTTDELVKTLFAPSITALDVHAFRVEAYRGAIEEIPGNLGDSTLAARMRQVIYLFLTRFLPEQLNRAHRFGAAMGLDVRTPFCDRELVEYVFNVPWSVQNADGREKSLLRAAVADLLPDSVIGRRKSGYPMTGDDGYDHALRTELGKLHLDAEAPVRAFIDEDLLRAVHADLGGTSTPRLSRNEMELALKLNAWLKRIGLEWYR